MRAAMHAGMPATRVPGASGQRGQRPAGELPRLVITRGGQGPRPHRPGLTGRDMGTMGLWKPARGNAILAAAARRCLDHLVCSVCQGVV
jgi:hypothetical protein